MSAYMWLLVKQGSYELGEVVATASDCTVAFSAGASRP